MGDIWYVFVYCNVIGVWFLRINENAIDMQDRYT